MVWCSANPLFCGGTTTPAPSLNVIPSYALKSRFPHFASLPPFCIASAAKAHVGATGRPSPRSAYRRHEPSAMQPLSPHLRSCRGVCDPLVMCAAFWTNPSRADETSRSEFRDPVCRPIRLCCGFRYSLCLRCRPLRGTLLAFKAARRDHVGPIPAAQASRFRQTFQALFCRGPIPPAHATSGTFRTRRARGTPVRSVRGGDGASPVAENSAATAAACPAPSSTTRMPPGASSAGATAAIAR